MQEGEEKVEVAVQKADMLQAVAPPSRLPQLEEQRQQGRETWQDYAKELQEAKYVICCM